MLKDYEMPEIQIISFLEDEYISTITASTEGDPDGSFDDFINSGNNV